MERLSSHNSEMDLLYEVLGTQHPEEIIAAQLIPKISESCEKWLRANKLPDGIDTDRIREHKDALKNEKGLKI